MNRLRPGQEGSANLKLVSCRAGTSARGKFLSVQKVTLGSGRCRLGTVFIPQ